MATWQLTHSSNPGVGGYLRGSVRAMPGTIGVWTGSGIAVGICLSTEKPTVIVLIASIIAGLIVCVPMGVALALAGARWKGSLVGTAFGLVLGTAGAVIGGQSDLGQMAATGLIMGGMMGGTVMTVGYRLPRAILSEIRQTCRSCTK
jgi:hypothetical protein